MSGQLGLSYYLTYLSSICDEVFILFINLATETRLEMGPDKMAATDQLSQAGHLIYDKLAGCLNCYKCVVSNFYSLVCTAIYLYLSISIWPSGMMVAVRVTESLTLDDTSTVRLDLARLLFTRSY